MEIKNILVAIDFIDATPKLLDYAIKLAKIDNAKIWLLHVDNTDLTLALDSGFQYSNFTALEVNPFLTMEEKVVKLKLEHEHISRYINMLHEKHIEASGFLIEGSIESAIIEKTKELSIDTIIVGHHKHSLLYSVFFGDNSSKLIRQSDVPVYVIPYK